MSARNERLGIATAAALCAATAGCFGEHFDCGCPDYEPIAPPAAGIYRSVAVHEFDSDFPHGDEPKELLYEARTGTVRITYQRMGRTVVETWRVTAVSAGY